MKSFTGKQMPVRLRNDSLSGQRISKLIVALFSPLILVIFFIHRPVRFLRASILLVCRMAVTRLPGHARNRSFGRSKNVFCIHRAGGVYTIINTSPRMSAAASQTNCSLALQFIHHTETLTHTFFKCRLRNELLTQWDLPQIKAPLMRQKVCDAIKDFCGWRKNSWNYTCGCFLIRHESG